MKNFFIKNKKGVTLIELIFTVALFSIVIIVVLTLLSMGITAQRKALALQDVQDNARFMLEFIAKEIRMGIVAGYSSTTLTIVRPDGENIVYTFSENDIQRTSDTSSGPINSENMNVTGSFSVFGIGAADALQPKVTISLSVQGQGSKTEEQARIDLQTTLSQRTLDMP